MDKLIATNNGKIIDLEDKKAFSMKKIIDLKEKLQNNTKNASSLKKIIKIEENKLETLEKQIFNKKTDNKDLNEEKDLIIKKCLMNLHTQMKKDYKQVNENHDRYVELYTQAREEKHVIERKMMNLKSIVFKNYKIRLM